MNLQLEELFFTTSFSSLANEDNDLRMLFSKNEKLYEYQHNGICCLYETTLVYTIFKGLLRNGFPLEISWEHSYPDRSTLKADLALIRDDQTIDSLIEFKIWLTEDGREVRSDVEKYKLLNLSCDKYLFVVEYAGGNIEENTKYLIAQNPELQLVRLGQFKSNFYVWTKKQREDKDIFVYLFKMKS